MTQIHKTCFPTFYIISFHPKSSERAHETDLYSSSVPTPPESISDRIELEEDPIDCSCLPQIPRRKIIGVTVTVALIALMLVAAYFCFSNGLQMPHASAATRTILIYMGASYTIAALGNVLFYRLRHRLMNEPENSPLTTTTTQVVLSLLAPLVVLPSFGYFGAKVLSNVNQFEKTGL